MPGMSNKRISEDQACEYLNQIKQRFGDQPEKWSSFIDVMKSFKLGTSDAYEVMASVLHLFHGHPDLVVGFNVFLPPSLKRINVFDSIMQQRFAHQQEVCEKFQQVIRRYEDGGLSADELKAQVTELFAGHDDLISDFDDLLPIILCSTKKANKRARKESGEERAINKRLRHAEHSDQEIETRDQEREGELEMLTICPISMEVMVDPVLACDGHTYDRENIEKAFRLRGPVSPMTNAELNTVRLVPNVTVRTLIGLFHPEVELKPWKAE